MLGEIFRSTNPKYLEMYILSEESGDLGFIWIEYHVHPNLCINC